MSLTKHFYILYPTRVYFCLLLPTELIQLTFIKNSSRFNILINIYDLLCDCFIRVYQSAALVQLHPNLRYIASKIFDCRQLATPILLRTTVYKSILSTHPISSSRTISRNGALLTAWFTVTIGINFVLIYSVHDGVENEVDQDLYWLLLHLILKS